jgi:hypothetical protein
MVHAVKEVEKRLHWDERDEVGSNTNPSECSGSSHNIKNEGDEEDEEPQPAKRRKRDSQLSPQTPAEVSRVSAML